MLDTLGKPQVTVSPTAVSLLPMRRNIQTQACPQLQARSALRKLPAHDLHNGAISGRTVVVELHFLFCPLLWPWLLDLAAFVASLAGAGKSSSGLNFASIEKAVTWNLASASPV